MGSRLLYPLSSQLTPKTRKILSILAVSFLALVLVYGVYLWHLFGKLDASFHNQEEYVPTRIYSDVSRIAPPQLKRQVLSRLRSLNYTYVEDAEQIRFTLRTIDYPYSLIPDQHPTLNAGGQEVFLFFMDEDSDAPLQSIHVGGEELSEIFLEPELVATLSRGQGGTIRDPLKFEQIPAPVWKAIIAVEDQHYMDHSGFDPRGIARAILVNLSKLSFAQGGSTITQQLVKNLMVRRTKNLFQKINELFLSLMLEARYQKEEILERYLNEVYLGQVGSLEVHGVAEGAEHFFGKDIKDLSLGEIALMAGLIRGPGYYSPYRHLDRALERQRFVLKQMVETNQIAQAEADLALAETLTFAPPIEALNKAPYFNDYVKAELIRKLKDRMTEHDIIAAGFRVYTTLDMLVNNAAQDAVSQGLKKIEADRSIPETAHLEGALAAVDQSKGYVRALVGGRDYRKSTFNRILNMKRQVGSTFKPVVYLSAFLKEKDEEGVPYSPGYPIQDVLWTLKYDHGRQQWTPRNYGREYRGWITLREALANSVNTVTAKLGVRVGIPKVIETARALQIQSELPPVPSLSLGVSELSPVELVQAYAIIGNHGVHHELAVIRGISVGGPQDYEPFFYYPKQVLPEGPVDLVRDILQDVFTDGTARNAIHMGFDRPAAGKTGTTSHYRDAWFAGFTPQLTAVVWVGMDQARVLGSDEPGDEGEDTTKPLLLTGSNSALPIWTRFMNDALAGEPPAQFPHSPHLTQARIDKHTGQLALYGCTFSQTTVEMFIEGNLPTRSTCEDDYSKSPDEAFIQIDEL